MWESSYEHVAKSTRPVSGTTLFGRQSATSEPFSGPSPKTRICSALETWINSSYIMSRFILLRTKDVTPPKSPFIVVILLSQEMNADVAVPSLLVLSDDPYRSMLYVHQQFNRRRDQLTLHSFRYGHIVPPNKAHSFVNHHHVHHGIRCDHFVDVNMAKTCSSFKLTVEFLDCLVCYLRDSCI